MTDYNDGEWHLWNGSRECPVHPKSKVDCVWHHEVNNCCGSDEEISAKLCDWPNIIKFRVVAEHKHPREYWYDPGNGKVYRRGIWHDDTHYKSKGYILLREVRDDE